MTTPEMHVWFRQYAQQMGMQNVRAILPEQIDLLINTSINDVVNQLIRENIGITNDRVITDNSKIGQINAFRTLYRVNELQLYNTDDSQTDAYLYLNKKDKSIGKLSNERNLANPTICPQMPSYLFLVDVAINYMQAGEGYEFTGNNVYYTNDVEFFGDVTNYFPVRIIDDAYLADTLNDYILKPRVRTPIMVVYSKTGTDSDGSNTVYDLYIDKFSALDNNTFTLPQSLIPYTLRMSYIAKPAPVKYVEDLTGNAADNINCDLPDSLHVDILKHAVDLYRTSVSGALYTTQQQADNNAREAQRNNYRNENN